MTELDTVQECLVRMVVELWIIQADLESFQARCKPCNVKAVIRLKCIDHKLTAVEKWMGESGCKAKKVDLCQEVLESLLQKNLMSTYNISTLTRRLDTAIAFVGEKIRANNVDGKLQGLTRTHEHVAEKALQSKKCLKLQNMLSAMS